MSIELVEYRTTRVELLPDEVDALLPLVRGALDGDDDDARVLQALTPTVTPHVYDVRSGPYVGRLGLPTGRWVDFTSRFPIEDVFQLVVDAQQLPVRWSDVATAASVADFFVDVLATSFVAEVERLVHQGLMKHYEPQRHVRPPYAGRLDVTHHLNRYAGRPDRIVTMSNRLNINHVLNGVLAAAIDRLRRVVLRPVLRRRLDAALPPFARVERVARDVRAVAAAVREAPPRYTIAAALAALVLQTQALAPQGEGYTAGSMLFYMPPVWEAFVCRWAQSQLPHCRIEPAYSFPLGSDGEIATADAVAFAPNGSIEALFDAKYKWADGVPKRSDLYQMVAYCTALGIDDATLVYPVEAGPRSVRVGTRTTVHVVGAPPIREGAPEARLRGWRILRLAN